MNNAWYKQNKMAGVNSLFRVSIKWTLSGFPSANVENRLVLLRSLGESITQLMMIMMIMTMIVVVKGEKIWISN